MSSFPRLKDWRDTLFLAAPPSFLLVKELLNIINIPTLSINKTTILNYFYHRIIAEFDVRFSPLFLSIYALSFSLLSSLSLFSLSFTPLPSFSFLFTFSFNLSYFSLLFLPSPLFLLFPFISISFFHLYFYRSLCLFHSLFYSFYSLPLFHQAFPFILSFFHSAPLSLSLKCSRLCLCNG